jgi:hypothetical protein
LREQNEQLQQQNQQFEALQAQAQANACINNLRQIDGATEQWALENRKQRGALVTPADLAPYLKGEEFPACPAGGIYTIVTVGTPPTCNVPGHALQ